MFTQTPKSEIIVTAQTEVSWPYDLGLDFRLGLGLGLLNSFDVTSWLLGLYKIMLPILSKSFIWFSDHPKHFNELV